MLHYYIYYRVDPARAADAQARVADLMEELDLASGVRGRLLRKRDEPHLWMEIYEEVEDGPAFEAALATHTAAMALEALLQPGSTRRIECFRD